MSKLVSINCTTYNHEAYIADAIESFLMQETDFDFEILIGEDCSTDNTRKIVESYASKYPDKIRMITSEANVGGRQNSFRLLHQSEGKYIAFCEGDDYWTDPYKLQMQVDYMEKNPKCSLCFHAADIVNVDKQLTGKSVKPYVGNRIVPIEDIILGDGDFFATGSIMYPKKLRMNPPEWFFKAHVGDYPLAMILASIGDVYYIDQNMSAYRTGVKGSWTERTFSGEDVQYKFIKNCERDIWILNQFNQYTNYLYSPTINAAVSKRKKFILNVIKKYMDKLKSL